MKKIFLFVALCGLIACSRNLITGRSQLSLIGEEELRSMAVTEYRSFLSQNKVLNPSSSKDAEMVQRVGKRLAAAITEYYRSQGISAELEGYNWEYNLVDSDEANAWAMPGGKIVVYTGLLPITQNEAALAVVLGHEITHALTKHSNERMSQAMLAQGLGELGSIALANNPKASNVFNAVYGSGAQLGVLMPNSRNQELEADRFGLIFTAMAGYNPREAIPLWERMAAAGGSPPEFLSTHPSPENRIKKLQQHMNEAMKYYKPVK